MAIIRKKYFQYIKSVLDTKKSIFFVWGRQVWKTTLMKSYLEENNLKYFYINFDEIFSYSIWKFSTTKEFIDYVNFYYKTDILSYDFIVFDEVIKIQNFNVILKSLIDKYKDKTFFCSSSWEYETVNNIIEGLAWRIVKINVYPLDFYEFLEFKGLKPIKVISENTFNLLLPYLKEYLTFGAYPEVVLQNNVNNKKVVLKSIVDSIFQKDILKLVKEEKILDLRKFILLVRNNIWSLFSYEWFANKLWIKLNDLKKFVFALEKIWLLYLVNPFFTDKSIEVSSKHKIYINDWWIYNMVLNDFLLPDLVWKHIEQFVFSQLQFNIWLFDELNFYRKLNETEIDFVYKTSDWIIPIKVKMGNSDNIPKVFGSFCEKYSSQVKYFVKASQYLNKERLIKNCKVKIVSYLNVLEVVISSYKSLKH